MQNPPATIYVLSSEHSADELASQLDGYSDSREVEDLDEELITTINSVTPTDRGLQFKVEHDFVQQITQRGRDEPLKIKATQSVIGRFCNGISSDGFILMGSNHKVAAPPVTKAIEGDSESFAELSIPTTDISRIVSADSELARYKIWEDIDIFTNMASIKGKIEDSTYSQDFDEHGRPVWVMFDSQSLGKTVGVSQQGFVVYGNDIEAAEVESYYFNIVKDILDS